MSEGCCSIGESKGSCCTTGPEKRNSSSGLGAGSGQKLVVAHDDMVADIGLTKSLTDTYIWQIQSIISRGSR